MTSILSFAFERNIHWISQLIKLYHKHTHTRSALLLEETGVPGENHRPAECHWQTLYIEFYRVHLAVSELRADKALIP